MASAVGSLSASTEMSLYRASMHRILRYVGLPQYEEFSLTSPPQFMPSCCDDSYDGLLKDRKCEGEARADESERQGEPISHFFEMEDSSVWKEYLESLPRLNRHVATVRRRLSTQLWIAHKRKCCLYCWVPRGECICHQLDVQRAKVKECMPSAVRATMVMHSEEIMTFSNSGRIAAYILDAPLCVWGIPSHSEYLLNLAATERDSSASAADGDSSLGMETVNLLLYPIKNATLIEDFVRSTIVAHHHHDGIGCNTGSNAQATNVHIFALDGTWNQAVTLNRHISGAVPRVALTIAPDYEPLFFALRKQTRATGVSTLEALGMAMEQCVTGMGRPEDAQRLANLMRDTMKIFVDRHCILKRRKPLFGTIPPRSPRIPS